MIIYCEGRSVQSTVKKDTLQPEFATSGIFYRKKPRKPITVEVKWHLSVINLGDWRRRGIVGHCPVETMYLPCTHVLSSTTHFSIIQCVEMGLGA